MTTLTQLLEITGHPITATAWDEKISSHCLDDIIERFDDSWESLADFQRSDWVNLAECYTYQLLERWQRQERDIMALFNEYCDALGATSTMQALEGECDGWADGDDMNVAIVNHAMTWGALELLRHLTYWAEQHTDHEGPVWETLRSLA